jgi:hypothetical protein
MQSIVVGVVDGMRDAVPSLAKDFGFVDGVSRRFVAPHTTRDAYGTATQLVRHICRRQRTPPV